MAEQQETKFLHDSQKEPPRGLRASWLLLLALLLFQGSLVGQTLPRLEAPVYPAAGEAPRPLATVGGLNNPQPANVDWNRDGRPDLFIFDRAGHVLIPLINEVDRYRFDPAFRAGLPYLTHWVVVRDFNRDGAADLFAYSGLPGIDGISAYRGYYQQDSLQFAPLHTGSAPNLLTYQLGSGGTLPIFVSKIDYPEVNDMDCDGDMDILTFNAAGGFIEFYRNLSVERGYGLDSLIFELADPCWGGLFESGIGQEVDLAPGPGQCAERLQEPPGVVVRHAGSTLLTVDPDGDGVRDLILGDLSFNNLNYLTNAGTCEEAWIERQEPNFPPGAPVDLPYFPAAFLVDVTRDGRPELVASPNALGEGADREVLRAYRNAAADGAAPSWTLLANDWLVADMVDLGAGLYPAMADIDQDGLTDWVAGNAARFLTVGENASSLHYFRNIGSPERPAFRLLDANFLDLARLNPDGRGFAPHFADLDGDRDLDLLVGEELGGLYFLENTAGPGRPMTFAPPVYPFMQIDVGLGSVPAVADVNRDGLPDLVVGERNGNLNLFLNRGTTGAPDFPAEPDDDFWGGIDARQPGSLVGYSAPAFLQTENGLHLLLGTQAGRLERYRVGEEAPFELLDDDFGEVREGFRVRPALADLDQDNLLELMVGNLRGGIGLFETGLAALPVVSTRSPERSFAFRIWPNPSSGPGTLEVPPAAGASEGEVRIFDARGLLVAHLALQGRRTELPTDRFAPGIYLVEVHIGRQRAVRRWVVHP